MPNYNDILHLPYPHLRHRRMPLLERAAQFAPFAALSGFDRCIGEEARLTGRRPAVSDEDALVINDNLRLLLCAAQPAEVRLTYFVPDACKDGGEIVGKRGRVRRVDTVLRTLAFTDKTVVSLDAILTLDILC